MIDVVVNDYMKNHFHENSSSVNEQELKNISDCVKEKILAEAFKENEKLLLKQLKEKMKEEKRKDKNARINHMILETIFLALCIGLIVNQITSIIPSNHPWIVILIVSILCVLVVLAIFSSLWE